MLVADSLIGFNALRNSIEDFDSCLLYTSEAHRRGLPNEMNYVMDYRLIHCLRNGLPLDMDVYDAAEWSCRCV